MRQLSIIGIMLLFLIGGASASYTIAAPAGIYESWPDVSLNASGTMFVFYSNGSGNTHLFDATRKVVIKKSTDNGVTFGNEITVSSPGEDTRSSGLLIFNNATTEVYLAVFHSLPSDLTHSSVYFSKSLDKGNTWSTRALINNSLVRYSFGKPIYLSNGHVLATTYDQTDWSVHISDSSDWGDSWTDYTVVTNSTMKPDESSIIELKNATGGYSGDVMMIVRTEASPYTFYKYLSTDYGVTWSTAISPLTGFDQPNVPNPPSLMRTTDDRLVVTFTTNKIIWQIYSVDEGITWKSERQLVANASWDATDGRYSRLVQLNITANYLVWCTNANPNPSGVYGDVFLYPLLSSYSPTLKILLHMNRSVDHPTWFNDSSSNNYKGITTGDTITNITSKQLGNASAYFDGNGDYITYGTTSDFKFLNDPSNYTFSAWVQFNNFTTTHTVLSTFDTSSSNVGVSVLVDSSRKVTWQVTRGSAATYVLDLATGAGAYPNDNGWHQIVGRFDYNGDGNAYLYIDGHLAKTQAKTGLSTSGSNTYTPLTIGRSFSAYLMYGGIDEIAIWNGASIPISNLYPQYGEYGAVAPLSAFTANITEGESPLQVQFTDTTTNTPVQWWWAYTSLADPTLHVLGNQQNPIYTFGIGNYSIKLNTSNTGGVSVAEQITWINVTESINPPTASFICTPTTAMLGESIACTDTSSDTPTNWTYYWGDGNVTDGTQNPSYTYPFTGTFSINQTVNNTLGGSWYNRSNYITITNLSGFTQQDLWQTGQYTITFNVKSSTTNLPIANVTVVDSVSGQSYPSTNGTAFLTLPAGLYYINFIADGYQTKQVTYVVDQDEVHEVTMVPSAPTSDPVYNVYPPKDVKFHITSFFGAPLTDATVTIQGITTSTGNWDWLVTLLGISLDEVAINGTAMSETTDSNGDVVFLMLPSVKYNITTTATGYTFPTSFIAPQATEYTITANWNESWFSSGNDTLKDVNVSVSWVKFNDTYSFVNITYDDQTMTTTGGTITVYRDSAARVANASAVATMDITSSSCSNSTLVNTPTGGASYRVLVNATTTDENIMRTFTHYFKGSPVSLPGWTSETLLWLSLFIVIFTAAFAGAIHSPQMSIVLCVESWIFWAIGWLDALITQFWYGETAIIGVLVLASFLAVVWNITEGKSKVKRSS